MIPNQIGRLDDTDGRPILRAFLIFFSLVFSILAPANVFACSCVTSPPTTCTGPIAGEAVFVGTVMHIDNPAPEDGRLGASGESHYRFHMDEELSGIKDSEIDIYSGRGGADCSYHFQQGQQYLVSPYRDEDGRLFATICSITRPIELAQALLPQLRAMRDHNPVASLYGVLRSAEEPYGSVTDDFVGKALPGTRVELRSEKLIFRATTDSTGTYAFYGVPKGEYQITAELPTNLELAQMILDGPIPPIKLPEAGCYEYDVTAFPTGNIRGRVLGPDGRPLAFASLQLFHPEKYSTRPVGGWMESQDLEKGYFEFNHVGPGDYILIYNNIDHISADSPYPRTFYPGVSDSAKAGRIHVEAGQRVDGIDIRLAGSKPTRSIRVRLVAEGGKLPNISYVETHGDDGSTLTEQETSPAVYEISLFKNVRYTMHGEGYCSATDTKSRTDVIKVDGADDRMTEIALVFRGPGCGE